MDKRLERRLFDDFPRLYRQRDALMTESCMYFGVDTGRGWYDIIRTLSKQLEALIDEPGFKNLKAEQVKEKFGTLHFYVKGVKGEAWKRVVEHTQVAQDLSAKTCEECGKPGKRTTTAMGWIQTLCPKCKKEDKRVAKIKERDIIK